MTMTSIPNEVGELGTVSKHQQKRLGDMILEEESKPSRPQHCSNQLDYFEESWRVMETCHSDSLVKTTSKTWFKN